jgi:hypothetical protein
MQQSGRRYGFGVFSAKWNGQCLNAGSAKNMREGVDFHDFPFAGRTMSDKELGR